MKSASVKFITLLVGSVALLLWLWGVNLPYVGIYNANNNYLAIASENFLRFGYQTLKFLPTYFVGPELPVQVPYYLHHPVLFFLLASLPFAVFGFGNWVVHVTPFVFTVGSLVPLYFIIREVSGARVAWFSLVMAVLFPMMSFFWKYMFFEQPSLFFTLSSLLFFLRYVHTKKRMYLTFLFGAALLGGATDWYGGYLVPSLLYLYFVRRTPEGLRGVVVFLLGLLIGLGTYLAALVAGNSIGAVIEGFSARALTSELTSLSIWPLRLVLVTLIRMVVYFSPFLLVGLWHMRKLRIAKDRDVYGNRHLAIAFLLLGLINPLVLPAATWGHSYFLYYLIPFAAYMSGLWLIRLSRISPAYVWVIIGVQMLWSVSINGLKVSQVRKQSWKFDMANEVSVILPKYSVIGVYGFPGDVFENYFDMRSFPLSRRDVEWWATGYGYKDLSYVIISCMDQCQSSELAFISLLSDHRGVYEFRYGAHVGWLFTGEPKNRAQPVIKNYGYAPSVTPSEQRRMSIILQVYRRIRDLLGSTQI